MKRLILIYLLLLLASLWITSCRTHKDISQRTEQTDSTSSKSQTDETTTSSTHSLTSSAVQAYGNRFVRDGFFDIEFDSLTSLHISPDGDIRATGYAPTIRSHTSESSRDTASITSTASQIIQKDSTGKRENQEEAVSSSMIKQENKKVTRTPSLTPWIGVGIALVLIILTILWYFFGRPRRS